MRKKVLNTLNTNPYKFSKNQARANTAINNTLNNTAETLAFRANNDHRRIRPLPTLLALGTALNLASCASQPTYTYSPKLQRPATEQVQSGNTQSLQNSLNNCAKKAAEQGVLGGNLKAGMEKICPDSMQAARQLPQAQQNQLGNSVVSSYKAAVISNAPTAVELKNSLVDCTIKALQNGANPNQIVPAIKDICPRPLQILYLLPQDSIKQMDQAVMTDVNSILASRNNNLVNTPAPIQERPTSEIGVGDIPDEYLPPNSAQPNTNTGVTNPQIIQQAIMAEMQCTLKADQNALNQGAIRNVDPAVCPELDALMQQMTPSDRNYFENQRNMQRSQADEIRREQNRIQSENEIEQFREFMRY